MSEGFNKAFVTVCFFSERKMLISFRKLFRKGLLALSITANVYNQFRRSFLDLSNWKPGFAWSEDLNKDLGFDKFYACIKY